MAKKPKLVVEIGSSDYRMCKEALSNVITGTPSASRLMATMRWQGREMWSLVVDCWEETTAAARQQCPELADDSIDFVRIFDDGSVRAIHI